MYVDNKYFNQGSDSWENYSKTFSEVSISPTSIPYGARRDALVSFTMPNDDNTPVTLTLTGLEDASGNKTPITVTPTAGSSSNVTVTASGTDKVVKVTGLYTSTISDQVTVHIDADGYKDEKVTASRHSNQFVVTGFDPSMITGSGDLRNLPVTYTFTVPTYYDNMGVNVTLDGLLPADDDPNGLREVEGRSAIKTYTFKPGAAGTYVLKLKTINKDACTCSLTLEAEKYYYETVTTEVKQAEVQYGYQNISVPESVAQGENRDVKIEFDLDPTDANRAGKKVNVTLVGMALNGSTSAEVTANNNGKVSFTAKTTDATGHLSVTFSADGYPEKTITWSDRPVSQKTETISFANTNQRISRTNEQQVWKNGNIKLTNDKGTSKTNVSNWTNPVRFYADQKLTIDASNNKIVQIVFTCANANMQANYANNLKNSIGDGATVSGNNVTVTLDSATSYVITLSGDVRLNSLEVTYLEN